MEIDDFCEQFYEDLNGQVIDVTSISDGLVIHLETDCWHDPNIRRKFRFHATGVLESDAHPGFCGGVVFSNDHPLAWDHNCPYQDVYYSTAPDNAAEVIGKLYETHERIFYEWRPLAHYLSAKTSQLVGGNGLLASAPQPVAVEYIQAVEELMRVYTVKCHRQPKPSKALVVGDSFVICAEVLVTEVFRETS